MLVSRTERRLEKADAAVEERRSRRGGLVVPTDIDGPRRVPGAAGHALSRRSAASTCWSTTRSGCPPMDPLTKVDAATRSRRRRATNVLAPLRLSRLLRRRAGGVQRQHRDDQLRRAVAVPAEYARATSSPRARMLHMAQSLATELGPRGIRVNSVAPSWIYEDVNKMYFDWLASRARRHPPGHLRREGRPDRPQAARARPRRWRNVALLLASPLASAVTGQCLRRRASASSTDDRVDTGCGSATPSARSRTSTRRRPG